MRRVQLVPIGRFSQITRLTIKQLRHYDRLGVLRPAVVDEDSGYRYYGLAQVDRAVVVRLLRRAGVSLDDIASLLGEADPATILQRLRVHRDRLERSMAEIRTTLAHLERIVEQKEGLTVYEVEVKQVPEQSVLLVRKQTTMEGIGDAMGQAFGELMAYMGPAAITPAGPPLCVYTEEFDGESGGEMWVCMPVPPGAAGKGAVEAAIVPGGTMAATVHQGPYDTLGQAYAAVFGWIEEHGHQPAGPMRDVYLTDPDQVPPEEYRTEVQWPIA